MDSFVELLLSLAEKSSKIARLLHQDKGLFDTLVEEKRGEGKNKRFRVDYKTLADTLIQEIFKHFIAERVSGSFKQLFLAIIIIIIVFLNCIILFSVRRATSSLCQMERRWSYPLDRPHQTPSACCHGY